MGCRSSLLAVGCVVAIPWQVRNEALVFPLMCSLWDVVNSVLFLGGVWLARRKGLLLPTEPGQVTDGTEEEGGRPALELTPVPASC